MYIMFTQRDTPGQCLLPEPADSRQIDIELPLYLPDRRTGARATSWTRAAPTEASMAEDLAYRRRLRVEEAVRQEQRNSPDAYKRTPGSY